LQWDAPSPLNPVRIPKARAICCAERPNQIMFLQAP
jgi:hypothetical protein